MLIDDHVAAFAEFAAEPGDDLVARWRQRVVRPHAGLYRAIEPWLDPADAPGSLPALVGRRAELLDRARRAQGAVRQAQALVRQALPEAADVHAVVLVGLGKANGWATPVNGEPTLFLAVDRLPEPGFDVALALHELIHVEHLRRASSDWPANRVDADLFREGLAVHATARLLPGLELSGHMWFAAGHEDWIERCRTMHAALHRRALADLRREDVTSRWFSGTADRSGDLPGRCGYWLGRHLADRMMTGVPLDVAMRWSLPDVSARLQRLLEGRDTAH